MLMHSCTYYSIITPVVLVCAVLVCAELTEGRSTTSPSPPCLLSFSFSRVFRISSSWMARVMCDTSSSASQGRKKE
jgi:hypothetical protein